ncbi:MAG TPA: hypothetical protein DCG33_07230 [Prevotellaceae bacterium]|nr:hypothetical protein [Prevotellaceae bacterium]
MKKIGLIILLVLSYTTIFAQQEKGVFTIQPKVGINVANYRGISGSDSRIGFAAGLEAEYHFNRLLSMAVGILYSMQGDKETDNLSGHTAKVTDDFAYINVPVVLNLYVVKGLALKVGLQPAFNILSEFEMKSNGRKITGDYSDLLDVNAFDLSIPFGLSYGYKNIIVDGRYNLGVTKIVKNENSKNNVFQFTIGYKFKL